MKLPQGLIFPFNIFEREGALLFHVSRCYNPNLKFIPQSILYAAHDSLVFILNVQNIIRS